MTAAAIEAAATAAALASLVGLACLPSLWRAHRIRRSIPGGMSFRVAWVRATPNVHDGEDWSHLMGTEVAR